MDPEQRRQEDQKLLDAMFRERLQADASAQPSVPDDPSEILHTVPLEDLQRAAELLNFHAPSTPVLASLSSFPPPFDPDSLHLQSTSRFQLLRTIGYGGFGVVYLAFDRQLQRQVAVKMPRPDLLMTLSLVQRFIREGQNAAKLDHPNLVPVLSTDESFSLPAIVFPFCDGPTLTQFASQGQGPLPPLLAAKILLRLAEATQHAHARGIIHRDLKPANILMEPTDPSKAEHAVEFNHEFWIPRITDFGVSKWIENATSDSTHRAMIGTLQYMSPEQLLGKTSDIGTATDIYSLGVILFELLTQRPPHSGETYAAINIDMLQGPPPSIRTSHPDVPPDLEAIALRCLELTPDKRYPTAQALAEDLQQFLAGLPVQARPLTPWFRLRYLIHKQPVVSSLIALCVAMLFAWIAGLSVAVQRSNSLYHKVSIANHDLLVANEKAENERLRALNKAKELRRQVYASDLASSYRAYQRGDLTTYDALLSRVIPSQFEEDIRSWDWRYLWRLGHRSSQLLRKESRPIYTSAHSSQISRLAVAGAQGTIAILDAANCSLLQEWPCAQGEINSVAFSPSGDSLASAGDDGSISLWNPLTGQLQSHFIAHSQPTLGVSFQDENTLITSSIDPIIRLWNRSGQPLGQLPGHHRAIQNLITTPDRSHAISISDDHSLKVWNLAEQKCIQSLQPANYRLLDLALDPHGQLLAVTLNTGGLFLYQFDPQSISVRLQKSDLDDMEAIAFSHDGAWLATASKQGVVSLYRLDRISDSPPLLQIVAAWATGQGRLFDIRFDPSNASIDTLGADGTFRRWPVQQPSLQSHVTIINAPSKKPEFGMCFALLDDDHAILSNVGDLILQPLRQSDSRLLAKDLPPIIRLHSHPQHHRVFTAHFDGTINAWSFADHQWTHLWSSQLPNPFPDACAATALTYDASHHCLAVAQELPIHQIHLLDANSGSPRNLLAYPANFSEDDYGAIAFSLDGRYLAHGLGNQIALWDLPRQNHLLLHGHTNQVRALLFHPTDLKLYSSSDDRSIREWDLESTQETQCLRGHQNAVISLALLPNANQLVSSSLDGLSKVWQLSTGKELFDIGSRIDVEPSLQPAYPTHQLLWMNQHQLFSIPLDPPDTSTLPSPRSSLPTQPPIGIDHAR